VIGSRRIFGRIRSTDNPPGFSACGRTISSFSNVRLPQGLPPSSADHSSAGCFSVFAGPAFEAPNAYMDIPYPPRPRAEITRKRDA